MNMEYSQGRAAKAAQLHTVEDVIEDEPEKLWNVMQDWANDQQGVTDGSSEDSTAHGIGFIPPQDGHSLLLIKWRRVLDRELNKS